MAAADDPGPEYDRPMSLFAHLEELRRRLFWAVVVVAIACGACAYFQEELFALALAPAWDVVASLHGGALLVSDVGEMFFTSMKLVLVSGAFFAGPFVLYLIWGFVAQGLYPRERRWVAVFAPVSYLLFAGGCVFFYFVIQPLTLDVLLRYQQDFRTLDGTVIRPEVKISIKNAVSFFLTMSLVMGLIFELPLVMVFAQLVKLATWRTFSGFRRHFLMGALVGAALITPTGDMVTLGLFMLPIVVLFEGGILVCRMMGADET